MRTGTKMTLLIVMRNESGKENGTFAQGRWTAPEPGSTIAKRLSIYRYFKERGCLNFAIRTLGDNRSGEVVNEHLSQAKSLILLRDSEDSLVELSWINPVELAGQSEIAAEVRWSWGDPEYWVKHLADATGDIEQNASSDPEGEAALLQLVEGLPSPTLPWEEYFATPDNNGLQLYPHQQQAINAWLENGGKGIFEMCTGSGKTITSLFAIQANQPSYGPILVTVPTRVLADQWVEQIKRLGYKHILKAYETANNWSAALEPWINANSQEAPRFVVTTYKTFTDDIFLRKIVRSGAGKAHSLWIADEMHNLASTRLIQAMDLVGSAFPQRIGLSATPEIEGNPSMTNRLFEFFGGIVAKYHLKNGINDGVLCQYNYYPFPAYLDPEKGAEYLRTLEGISQAAVRSGSLLELYRQSREIIRTSRVQLPALDCIIDQIVSSGLGMQNTLVYCPPGYSDQPADESDEVQEDEDQSRLLEEVVKIIRQKGFSVSSILGGTPKSQRAEILGRFSQGTLDVLCAIGCLDEGIDIPSIKRAIVLYSIDREKQFIQRRGRILRTIRGTTKIADIYDVVILPHGTDMSSSDAERLLRKELRRHRAFSGLAKNASDARKTIRTALSTATQPRI